MDAQQIFIVRLSQTNCWDFLAMCEAQSIYPYIQSTQINVTNLRLWCFHSDYITHITERRSVCEIYYFSYTKLTFSMFI